MPKNTHSMTLPMIVTRTVITAAAIVLLGVLGWGFVAGAFGGSHPMFPDFLAGSRTPSGGEALMPGPDLEGGVLILDREAAVVYVLDPVSGKHRGTIDPAAQSPFETEFGADRPGSLLPAGIFPTPGGVSVFVTFEDRPEIGVFSTTTFEHQATIYPGNLQRSPDLSLDSSPDASGRIPDTLLFSENGDTLFVTWRNSPAVSVFSHSRLQLEFQTEFTVPGSFGSLYRNRRATRLYRDTDDGTAVVFARTGELIDLIPGPAADRRFNGSHTHLWGVTADGEIRIIDERRSEARSIQGRSAARITPVMPTGTGTTFILGRDYRQVMVFDARTGERIDSLELEFEAAFLAESGAGTVWAVRQDGRYAVIRAERPVVLRTGRLGSDDTLDTGPDSLPEVLRTVTIHQVESSIMQTEGSFACF